MGTRPRRLEAGQEVDGFRLEELLHRGGMATLWRVSRPGTDLPLVMKVPLIRDNDDPTPIVGFEVEQLILPRLHGLHVPRFVAQADFAVQPYIVMERLEGTSLKAMLERLPLPPEEVADLGARVALALHDLHRQGVVHLDVKPSNIMLRPTGEAVMIDFGLSRHESLPDLLSEEFSLPFGTAPYISPEQVLHQRDDPRSDIFALGVMLYYFATGERPFGIPHGRRALRRRLWRDPKPPRIVRRDLPPWLQEVILRCLEVDPDRRYQTAAQLALDLENPDQVTLTERSRRMERSTPSVVFRRWLKAVGAEPKPRANIARHLASAPIVAAAVDLTPAYEPVAEALRLTVQRLLATQPGARLACINVLRTSRIGIDLMEDAQGRNLHVRRLVELKHWARTLDLPEDRVTYAVLEAPDPAAALIDYTRQNAVDHLVMGARASSTVRRYLGSVSARVVAEAPCSVTVVRTQGAVAAAEAAA